MSIVRFYWFGSMLERSSNIHWNSGIKGLYEAVIRDITGESRWFECEKTDYDRFVDFLKEYEKTHLPNEQFQSCIDELALIVEKDYGHDRFCDFQNEIYEKANTQRYISNVLLIRARLLRKVYGESECLNEYLQGYYNL